MLSISAGLLLMAISVYFIYNAFEFSEVVVRGVLYRLEEDAISFCLFTGVYFLTFFLGFIWVVTEIRFNEQD